MTTLSVGKRCMCTTKSEIKLLEFKYLPSKARDGKCVLSLIFSIETEKDHEFAYFKSQCKEKLIKPLQESTGHFFLPRIDLITQRKTTMHFELYRAYDLTKLKVFLEKNNYFNLINDKDSLIKLLESKVEYWRKKLTQRSRPLIFCQQEALEPAVDVEQVTSGSGHSWLVMSQLKQSLMFFKQHNHAVDSQGVEFEALAAALFSGFLKKGSVPLYKSVYNDSNERVGVVSRMMKNTISLSDWILKEHGLQPNIVNGIPELDACAIKFSIPFINQLVNAGYIEILVAQKIFGDMDGHWVNIRFDIDRQQLCRIDFDKALGFLIQAWDSARYHAQTAYSGCAVELEPEFSAKELIEHFLIPSEPDVYRWRWAHQCGILPDARNQKNHHATLAKAVADHPDYKDRLIRAFYKMTQYIELIEPITELFLSKPKKQVEVKRRLCQRLGKLREVLEEHQEFRGFLQNKHICHEVHDELESSLGELKDMKVSMGKDELASSTGQGKCFIQ